MPSGDYRIALGLKEAQQIPTPAQRAKPRGSNVFAKLGLAYERSVGKELDRFKDLFVFQQVLHNPWFNFNDTLGFANCSPDFLIRTPKGLVVVEVKLTWVEVAKAKLDDLYCPVIAKALGENAIPLVICKNLTPLAPRAELNISSALNSSSKLLYWPRIGPLKW